MLDMVKKFENNFKLADPKSVTTHVDYCTYDHIPLIVCLQKDHTALVTDHEWPALASKLPQSSNATKSNSGPGPNCAHHQNGFAERAIQTTSNMARSIILHASMHWKDGIDATLWPQAVTYVAYFYNNTL
jgi:hypothetical protein